MTRIIFIRLLLLLLSPLLLLKEEEVVVVVVVVVEGRREKPSKSRPSLRILSTTSQARVFASTPTCPTQTVVLVTVTAAAAVDSIIYKAIRLRS